MTLYISNIQAVLSSKRLKKSPVFTLLPLMFLLCLSGCSEPSEAVSDTLSKPINTADIQQFSKTDRYQVTRQYVGKVKAKQHSLLGFEVSGKVTDVLVDVGDKVNKGDELAVLDIERLMIKHKELTANLQQISAQKKLNEANLKRQKSLISQGYTSEQRVDELSAEKSILAANAQTINANISSIEYQIKHSTLIAPFNGIVSVRHISQGDVVEAGKPIFNLFTEKDHEIHVGVPAFIAKRLQKELQNPVTVNIAGQSIDTDIIAISKHVDTSTQTVLVRLALPEHIDAYNEQLVKVSINETMLAKGFWVPLSALTDGIRGQWNILTALKSNQSNSEPQFILKKETINVLFSNQEQAYITGLPQQSLFIVASGVHRFVAEQQVITAKPNNQSKTGLEGAK